MIRSHANERPLRRSALRRSALVALLSIVAAVALASCGSDPASETDAAPTTTAAAATESETDEEVTTEAGAKPMTAAEKRWLAWLRR